MGRIAAPFGVKGWFRIQPFTAAAGNLLDYPKWWVGNGTDWEQHTVGEARLHGRALVARIEGCDDRDAAAGLRGRQIAVPRAQLPEPRPNEYYWTDLIGLDVVNDAGRRLGQVTDIMETGANDVLVVQGERERLIPFIADVIAGVDLESRVIRVSWDADF